LAGVVELEDVEEVDELPESDEELFDSVDFDSDAAGFASPPSVFGEASLASLPPSLPSVPFRA
jgi:hypothetical protein